MKICLVVCAYTNNPAWLYQEIKKLIDNHAPFIGTEIAITETCEIPDDSDLEIVSVEEVNDE